MGMESELRRKLAERKIAWEHEIIVASNAFDADE
jgi:hypothetical protein